MGLFIHSLIYSFIYFGLISEFNCFILLCGRLIKKPFVMSSEKKHQFEKKRLILTFTTIH